MRTNTSKRGARKPRPVDTEKQEEARAKRAALAELSAALLPTAKALGIRVNTLIVMHYQETTGQSDFRTFREWKEAGLSVKKGEKGFAVWSKPLESKDGEDAGEVIAESGEATGDEKRANDRTRYGVAYLFHAGQVERRAVREESAVS